ncbi:(d)CMP kinase [Limosilactobacillus fastidiosus]|uniref:Cytidylate kinase n=1 Tax=Limosilactobacillus fastidiosus TaxID=2759855 RepID=A0A7W3U0P4_9LACO|nr:(d)CMP kinase [Limosilactobacillus fastidiosus]MBB1062755.1 (d)CMP kinase [Limosilactobacillus fastidiosus]MBB1086510.1 (d)CMP kinase [Limosilactobacillus fastidiosus]MCD7084832.1 (d)CMP kinase [Limosilactobacillus fastidiosus]MCD7085138.1 (d)CMP kinase [Limosilactobacillus fastidiosus]MCD7115098.1 (d)CMP kinase [Limosilactobacillus fastidiosus]
MSTGLQVAIDGPASAGKSTVAKLVAKKFGYIYCDTGAMYRAVTVAALQEEIAMDDTEKIADLAKKIKITFQPAEPEQLVFINGQEVTRDIRLPKVAKNVSAVAAIPAVRQEMTKQQRQIAAEGGIVMDGRDIGTTVLPNAPVKIFMVATAYERARRRYLENKQKGIVTSSLEELQRAIELRDKKDSTRKVSPLTQASDAIKLDTTNLTIDEVVEKISEIIKKTEKHLA